MPPWALGSEPRPVPVLPAPEFSPVRPLPGPVPLPIPVPPPAPPTPGLSPPLGERANDPLPPLPRPGFEPGSADNTTPEFSLFPPAPLGGASTEPTSPGPPRPEPLLPEPVAPEPDPDPTEGGVGTMLPAKRLPLPEPLAFCDPEPCAVPEPETDGGGGITFAPRDPPPERADEAASAPCMDPVAEPPTEGGGGITFAFNEVPWPPLAPRELPAAEALETLGGGGTTSCVPKSFPMILLTIDPLAAWVGGGGTTFGAEERIPPLSKRRMSRLVSEGGGATIDWAGRLSFAVRALSRSGAETGGGTTVTLFICTRDGETSCVTADGAGAITVPRSAGAERVCSRETSAEAGAMTLASSEGAARWRSRDALGAGAMMLGSSFGAKRVCSPCTVGAGGTMEVRVRPLRD
jgi:hypothetical protein